MTELRPQLVLDAAQVWNPRQVAGLGGFAAVFLVIGGRQDGLQMALPVLGMIGLLAATGPFLADRIHGLDQLYGQLPTTRTTVVRSHYLVGVIAFLGAAAVATLAATLISPSPHDAVALALVSIAATAAVTAIAIPAIVRFGQQALLFVTFGLAALGALAVKAIPSVQARLVSLATGAQGNPTATAATGLTVLCLLWAASYLVTHRIYSRRDF